jgi:hypothetical protein
MRSITSLCSSVHIAQTAPQLLFALYAHSSTCANISGKMIAHAQMRGRQFLPRRGCLRASAAIEIVIEGSPYLNRKHKKHVHCKMGWLKFSRIKFNTLRACRLMRRGAQTCSGTHRHCVLMRMALCVDPITCALPQHLRTTQPSCGIWKAPVYKRCQATRGGWAELHFTLVVCFIALCPFGFFCFFLITCSISSAI